ncbi:MAG: class I SAM-dependent methyltransferase [Pseudomonadota bacterium]
MPDLTPDLDLAGITTPELPWATERPATVRIPISVASLIAFDVDVAVEILRAGDGEAIYRRHTGQDGLDIAWLPRGRYLLEWYVPRLKLEPGDYQLRVTLYYRLDGATHPAASESFDLTVAGEIIRAGEMQASWFMESEEGPAISELSWSKGHSDWFFRHFDHAARTVISYLLGDSPLLKGKVLDVGCGDGITDLGIFLRCQPEEMVGIDPFRGFDRLPGILEANHVPFDGPPEGLRFLGADGNHIPYPDDYFDVVVSWGSLEHIAGGYRQTLREIKRVLRDGGLFFCHPGLYYSNFGHHLGEFTNEPFVHLTRSPEELKRIVFDTPPNYMDRAGEFSPPEDYWRWYNELVPITVGEFEQELKLLEFDFYRVALRTEDLIEYHHPKLQDYGMQDLATVELYLSAFNRKSPRPDGFRYEGEA